MKVALLATTWLLLGLWVAHRAARAPAERALVVLFWPFFLGRGQRDDPLARLRAVLGDGDAAAGVVDELERALARLQARLGRVERALADLGSAPEGGELAAARERSRQLLLSARDACRVELDGALAAIEETATRLVLARELGAPGEVGALLAALRARVQAAEEVASAHPG